MSWTKTIINILDEERKATWYSFFYFFFLMSSYFILRPVRDEMGIQAGVENMQWLFTGTFLIMLGIVPVFGYLVQRVPRNKLILGIYFFFTMNILAFYLAFSFLDTKAISIVFFIWLSVFNLFVISVFWSFNTDIFSIGQAKRLFGPIAAGGSLGAIFGPMITSTLVVRIGILNLLLVSAVFLLFSTIFIYLLLQERKDFQRVEFAKPIKGNLWSGLKLIRESPLLRLICIYIILFTTVSTFLYFQQGHIVSNSIASSENRTSYFGLRDLLVNSFTLIIQFFLTEKIIKKWGLVVCLTALPIIACVGFFLLGTSPTIYVLLGFQIAYRSLNFSLQRPAREILFTLVGSEARYKSKNFIDTTVYRGGDAVSGWLFAGLSLLIASIPLISFLAIPIAIVWMLSGVKIGKLVSHSNQEAYEPTEHIIETTGA